MNKTLALIAVALTLGLAATGADAAKRFGGGSSIGQQRAAPAQKAATDKPAAAPTQSTPSQAPAAAPAAPAPKPSFMSRFGGLLAGLGIGALLGSLFGGNLGGLGTMLMVLLAGVVVFLVVRALMARRGAAPVPAKPVEFAGVGAGADAPAPRVPAIGGGLGGSVVPPIGGGVGAQPAREDAPRLPEGFEKEPFLRVAKTSFIRLQAANDAKDLDDIRDYTTPEMYAELSMQVRERGDAPQRTEVVSLEAELVEAVVEGDFEIASVRFYGLIREEAGANPEPFDEVWHVRKSLKDRKATWLIAGIQQHA